MELGPAERVDVIVEMDQPGVWILGDSDDRVARSGLGILVEYANRTGPPQWTAPSHTLGLHRCSAIANLTEPCRRAYSTGVQEEVDGKPVGGSLDHQRQGIPENRSDSSPRQARVTG